MASCADWLSAILATACLTVLGSTAHAALTESEARLLNGLDSRRALADIRHLSQDVVRTHSGLGDGTAVSGSREEAALANDIAAKMRAIGLSVRLEDFPVRAYRYGPVTLTADHAPITAISLHAAGGTWGTRDSVPYAHGNNEDHHAIKATLVDVAGGYVSDYARVGDVRGQVVLVHRELRDWPPAQITEAANRGASAVIFYDYSFSGDQRDALRQDSMWGHDRIPAVAIARHSAEALQQALARGAVEVTLENRVDVSDGHSQNVVGIIRGSELPDEWAMVAAHYDRWFQGAGDNTSGVASVLEVARAVIASGQRPRRSLLFMATGSEEAGLADPERDWLAGSTAFLHQHPDILRTASLIFNLDLVGWTSPSGTLMSTPDVRDHQDSLLSDLGYDSRMQVVIPTTSAIDAWNYGVVGGAAMNHLWRATFSGSPAYFPIYHTQLDVLRPEYYGNLQMDLRLIALSLWRAANDPRVPIKLSAIADFVGPLLEADAARVPQASFVDSQAALASFRKAAVAVEGINVEGSADVVDRLLMATRHDLVPWLYASNGDFEQVVRTTEYAQRVAVLSRGIAALQKSDRAGAITALGDLYEGRQCLRLSPQSYAEERGFWAGEGGWATQFGHRAAPPAPPFETACEALATPDSGMTAIINAFTASRDEAIAAVTESLAVITVKLRAATATLEEFARERSVRPGDRSEP
jgi:Zn-dependent M28 family amino/carboxypeptidase